MTLGTGNTCHGKIGEIPFRITKWEKTGKCEFWKWFGWEGK